MIEKESVIGNKKSAIKDLNSLLEYYINSENKDLLKKADLLSYWLKEYTKYIRLEDKFNPQRLISYSRGSVVRVNFGFNVGNEFGGLHFAIVLDNDNKHRDTVLTVVPLSSTDGKNVHPKNVNLGMELYERVRASQDALFTEVHQKLSEMQKMRDAFNDTLNDIDNNSQTMDINSKSLSVIKLLSIKDEIEKKEEILKTELGLIERNNKEIARMKTGSMAIINQITTISKQRIFTPKKSQDFLYGITLSTVAMEKINAKILELYCRGY